jgi:hypothetical protein
MIPSYAKALAENSGALGGVGQVLRICRGRCTSTNARGLVRGETNGPPVGAWMLARVLS